nr:MAG TPA: hypothetical protein [Caudoviricetes sp.]
MAKNIKRIKLPGVTDVYDVIDATAIHSEDVATSTKAGIVKIGSGITVAADGTISVNVTAPVTSVNSKTGAVVLTAADVGALPDTTTALKNPNALTFTGGATGSYDGSSPLSIAIPDAGSGGANIVVSRTQPTGQKAGDFWFQIVN